ncbi:flagellar hook capping FlgD N-terminal domain-containing protein [Pantoea sp. SO10]|uniref:flagellar hook capping FlgD N-terminal domain-containing protein n=1 Tax=Pantoea sp. SO10 TaxID=2575375 RepID=UPI0010C9BFF5|nr:flagellar hook capping FlgD N-terminal domain-containing protein [Pantoea sp. SO10]QCP60849.1 flagellar hook assembly protein FlgD [Pantoea sp. SO10]
MSVNNVNNSGAGVETYGQTPQSNGGTSSMFLTLLVAQIQNQDPTNPTDSADYINQLSMMSQMESMQTLTDTMTGVYYMAESMQAMGMANLVGQQVYASSNSIKLEGNSIDGRINLQHPAENVTLHIKDSAGKEVKLELGKQQQGDVGFTIDPATLGLADGDYTLSVVTDAGEEKIPIEIAGTVNSVRFDPQTGAPMINIPGLGEVAYNTIRQFGSSKNPAPAPFLSPDANAARRFS